MFCTSPLHDYKVKVCTQFLQCSSSASIIRAECDSQTTLKQREWKVQGLEPECSYSHTLVYQADKLISKGLTVMISPFSWKYLTNGTAFCLKFVNRLWVALRLSSGLPCCSARFNNLSFSRWLEQAKNTTRSGVQICGLFKKTMI